MMPGELFFSDGINTTLEKYFEYHITTKKKNLSKKKLKIQLSSIIDNILRISLKKLIIDQFGSL